MTRAGRPTLTTPEQWAQAALLEIECSGVRGLSVQSAARRLGVSKGGLYHHFRDRRALLQAALTLWEARRVTELGERFAEIEDPRERLRRVLVYAGVEMQPTVILQLMAAGDDPDVAAALRRTTVARLALLRAIFAEIGATPATAEHRAIMTYSHYLGLAELRTHTPEVLASPRRMRAHLRQLETSLLAGL
ncbi:MAG TPA: helix-turn-helix domain-containing protein [Solirubrobacteraceae bacterium]|nr:helix-turn-helix domain-containing protein [Solirubrobacteraceae bacterium]